MEHLGHILDEMRKESLTEMEAAEKAENGQGYAKARMRAGILAEIRNRLLPLQAEPAVAWMVEGQTGRYLTWVEPSAGKEGVSALYTTPKAADPWLAPGWCVAPEMADQAQITAGFKYLRETYARNLEYSVERAMVGCYEVMLKARKPAPISFQFGKIPDGFRLCRNEPGEMIHLDRLIPQLQKLAKDYGNTCVYARDVCWGAVAMNRKSDDEEDNNGKDVQALREHRTDPAADRTGEVAPA